MDRRQFLLKAASMPIVLTASSFVLHATAQATPLANQEVPKAIANDVYAIYSHFIATQLLVSNRKNAYSLIADQTCAIPAPPVEETVPPDFSSGIRRAVIVPNPVHWDDMQQILSDLRNRAKINYRLQDRFAFSSAMGSTQIPPVFLLDAQGQKELAATHSPQLFTKGQPVPVRSEQDKLLIDRLSRCEDLLRLSPVFFNRVADLAFLYGVDSNRDGWQDRWGVYAKIGGLWQSQGEAQGWFIVQPLGGEG
jgi:hypothetical protein